MEIRTQTKIGNTLYNMKFDGKDDMQTMHEAIVLSNPPQYCKECRNDSEFKMDSNKDKDGNVYINVLCMKCFSKAKLGLYKSGGYFWHQFKKYEKPQGDNQQSSNNNSNSAKDVWEE